MTQMVRNAAFTLCVVLYSSITLHAADPALAPEGWEGLRFGMTLQDAVAKLGPKAKHISAMPEAQSHPPFADTEEAQQYAANIVKGAKIKEQVFPEDVLKAAREIIRSDKPRLWITRVSRISGTYVSGGPTDYVEIRTPKGGSINTQQFGLDPKSLQWLKEYGNAKKILERHRAEEERSQYDVGAGPAIERPEQLVLDGVDAYGLSLQPTLVFGPRLCGVWLSCGESSDVKPGWLLSKYDAMCKTLAEDLGPPDNAVISDGMRTKRWVFTSIVVTATHHRESSPALQYRRGEGNILINSSAEHLVLSYMMPALPEQANTLPLGITMRRGESLTSENGSHRLSFEESGDLVLKSDGVNVRWRSDTQGRGGDSVYIDRLTGKLVMADTSGKVVWEATKANTPARGSRLLVQDDGNTVLYDGYSSSWDTRTNN